MTGGDILSFYRSLLGTVCLMVACAGGNMATATPDGSVTVACTVTVGTDLPNGFAAEFCDVLQQELAKNRSADAPRAAISIDLERSGTFSVLAKVTVRQATGMARSEDFSLSVKDSTLQPSVANVLLLPVLRLLE